ncbi:MAG: FtsX-like permease family protein [Bacteroidota bacterium]
MLKNYLKIAFRNLVRNKSIALINIMGLAIGLAVCLTILLFVQRAWSFDRYHTKADRIVRVFFEGRIQGEALKESHVMPPVAAALSDEFAEVEMATRLRQVGTPKITYKNQSFNTHKVAYADPNFFSVFDMSWLAGDPTQALVQPNTVVLTKTVAEKFFGTQNPMGKSLDFVDWNTPHLVTGVIDDLPENSHIQFDLFTAMTGFADARNPSWMVSEFYTYLVLQEGYDYRVLEAKLPAIFDKYASPQLQKAMGITLDEFTQQGNALALKLQPLTDIHLRSDFAYDLAPHGNINYVYIFTAIALFVLLIACINFMNLSTASASKRAKEVGVRKVVGSSKSDLIRQFLSESLTMTMIGLLVAIVIVKISLPYFNEIADQQLEFKLFANAWLIPTLLLFGMGVGLLAGSYPAFFLSAFRPSKVLKGRFRSGKENNRLRSGLVVFQFFLSITLIISTLVVYQQLQYIQNKALGFDKDAVLVIPNLSDLKGKEMAFRQQIEQHPNVLRASYSGYIPVGSSFNNNFFLKIDGEDAKMVKTLRYDVDEHYIPTLGMEMKLGRNFSDQLNTDANAIILNEAAVKALGLSDQPLDAVLSHNNNEGEQRNYQVIGVVKNFHFKSLHESIAPLVMVLNENSGAAILKVGTDDVASLLADLKNTWTDLSADANFNPSFFDDRINETYRAEQRVSIILNIFAGLTIFVAGLGLFGLTVFTAERRRKEIGIRKILGANVAHIVGLLSKDFLKLVLLAFALSIPLAWYLMQHWLSDFAYRADISWWLFALAGLAAIGIALLTVSVESIKAALANPVESLRNE